MASGPSAGVTLTAAEEHQLSSIAEKLANIQEFLSTVDIRQERCNLEDWYKTVSAVKRLLGNFDNDVSFIACLMAKQFLSIRHDLELIDTAAKPQGAPGLDFDAATRDGKRIIAEIKTTIPYNVSDLGSQQRQTFLRDFQKLAENKADFKYFFVTERETFEIVQRHYTKYLAEGISVVLLPVAAMGNSGSALENEVAMGKEQPNSEQLPAVTPSPLRVADRVRQFINDNYFEPSRRKGVEQLTLRSGDIHRKMNLHNRYPLVCSVMRSHKTERLCNVKIIKTEGSDGANFYITYSLV